ncbi:hypothetical protein [Massilia sp. TN1-12]|uniref:hypothetical protein n=1 Tax=Massilia paldalensis TaxID=3377675 RepID=UPI00384C0565
MVRHTSEARRSAAPLSRILAGLCLGLALTAGAHAARQPGTVDSYALVGANERGMTITGEADDWRRLKAVRKQVGDREFLWVREGGKAWVIQDGATLAKVHAAWEPVERLGKQMGAYGQEMHRHGKAMDALGREMDRTAGTMQPDERRIKDVERRMSAVGREMEQVGRGMARADADERARLQARMAELQGDMSRLGAEMGDAAQSRAQREAQQSMRQVSLRMDEASKPIDELGKRMDALGKQMERESERADKAVRAVIRDAMARGLATPAPQG